jgi:hypothetical protein
MNALWEAYCATFPWSWIAMWSSLLLFRPKPKQKGGFVPTSKTITINEVFEG